MEQGIWKRRNDETVFAGIMEFEQLLRDVKIDFGSGFTKKYRDMPEGEFVREVLEYLEYWTFIRREEREQGIVIYPSAGKMAGRYPKDYEGK